MSLPFDTTPDADAAQRDAYRRLGGRGRLRVAFGLTDTVRRLAIAGIRSRHPSYTDAQIRAAYARLVIGDELVRTVWPDDELVDP